MTILDILKIANEAYDEDNTLAMYYDPETGDFVENTGDTLARFIVIELQETFDKDATSADQLAEAYRVMSNAYRELERVVRAFDEAESQEFIREREATKQ